MAEGTKFTEEEMKSINDLQQTYIGLQNAWGQLSVSRLRLNQQLEEMDNSEGKIKKEFVSTQNKERDLVDSINKKYGDGNLDVNTGEFTPAPPAEEASDKTL